MERQFILPIGQDLIGGGLPTGQIGGMHVDNPSGSWLHVPDVDAWIPPYTMGWTIGFSPRKATISVRFENGPSGAPSSDEGAPPTVTLTSYPQPAGTGWSAGDPRQAATGLSKPRARRHPVTIPAGAALQVELQEGSPISGIYPFRIAPLKLTLSCHYISFGTDNIIHTLVFSTGMIGPDFQAFPSMSISPERPYAVADAPAGMLLGEGDPWETSLRASEYYDTDVVLTAVFYLVEVN